MKKRRVKTFAPATISNLGSGFDVLGLAIDRPGDIVIAEREPEPGLRFSVRTSQKDVPTTVRKNVAAHVANLMLKEFTPRFGVRMILHKQMPIGSGLGSSAASSVAAAVAVNALFERPVPKSELLRFILAGERMASGAGHADNAAPSLLGNACIIRSYDPLDVVLLPVSNKLVWVVVHPHLVVITEHARKILPEHIPMKKAIRQWGNVAGLTYGLVTGDAHLVGKCVEDVIVEPVRARLVRGFHHVKQAALKNGAYGCTLSGSGPSMFAVTNSVAVARKAGKAMARAFRKYAGVDSEVFVSRVNTEGATILSTTSR